LAKRVTFLHAHDFLYIFLATGKGGGEQGSVSVIGQCSMVHIYRGKNCRNPYCCVTSKRPKTVENWPNPASCVCPAYLEKSGPAGVICTATGLLAIHV
jgi:hypothetical protein